MDEEGFLFIVDRLKDMIISGGFNIYSQDVERALMAHDSVDVAAVVGLPDRKWGERVHAVVVLKAGRECSEEELIGFLRQSAGPLLTPKSIEFDSALPLTNLGKVDKKAIKLRLEAV
jgi:fatty-acyl-CoA synthase